MSGRVCLPGSPTSWCCAAFSSSCRGAGPRLCLASYTPFSHLLLSNPSFGIFPLVSYEKFQLRFPKVAILFMFFRTTWSVSSFPLGLLLGCPLMHFLGQQRCFFPVFGLLWKTWASSARAMGHSYECKVSKLPASSLVSLSDHLCCCRAWWCLVETLQLMGAFDPMGKSLPCSAAQQAQQLRAPRFCYEMCGTLSSDYCWAFDGINWLWIMQLSGVFNSVGSCVSEDLSFWGQNNSLSCIETSVWHYNALQ